LGKSSIKAFVSARAIVSANMTAEIRFAPGAAFSTALFGLRTSARSPLSFMRLTKHKNHFPGAALRALATAGVTKITYNMAKMEIKIPVIRQGDFQFTQFKPQ
jgi:hypothetical protein